MPMELRPIKRGSGKRAAEVAAEILRDTNNPAIGYGDSGLLHMVAEKLGWPHDGWLTESRVLNAIERNHEGVFVKRYYRAHRQLARVFYLPEHDPIAN